jgi:hypothetical protein
MRVLQPLAIRQRDTAPPPLSDDAYERSLTELVWCVPPNAARRRSLLSSFENYFVCVPATNLGAFRFHLRFRPIATWLTVNLTSQELPREHKEHAN